MTEQTMSRGRKALPTGHQPTADPEPELIDAEFWEEDQGEAGPTNDAADGYSWQERMDGARSFFRTRAQQRQEDRARRREQDREEKNQAADLSERDQLKLLRENVRAAGEKYMESLRTSDILVPGFNQEEREEKLSVMNRVYAQTMMMAGMKPLHQGVSPESVVRVMSTMAAMYMLSPQFKQLMGEKLEPIKSAIQSKIDAKAERKMGRSAKLTGLGNAGIERYNHSVRADNVSRAERGEALREELGHLDSNKLVSKKWQKRYDDMQFRKRGNREMFTAQSAGMTEVALLENAFVTLRQPGAATEEILSSYNAMITHLYRQAEADGLSREEVAEASRIMLGERIREDPSIQMMVNGLAHGQQRMASPQEARIAGTDKVARVWRGDFETYTGVPVDPTLYKDPERRKGVVGAFGLRTVMGADSHRKQMSVTMAMTMAQAASRGDFEAFNQDMAGYMMGCVTQASKADGEGLPGAIADRMFQSRTMQASMAADGLDIEQQRLEYSTAYAEAIKEIDKSFPEFAQQWNHHYGASWAEFTARIGTNPQEAYDRWVATQRGETLPNSTRTGPAPGQAWPGQTPPEPAAASGQEPQP